LGKGVGGMGSEPEGGWGDGVCFGHVISINEIIFNISIRVTIHSSVISTRNQNQ
jgi:hypothetical protein